MAKEDSSSKPKGKDDEEKDETGPMVPASMVFSAFGQTSEVKIYRIAGICFAFLSGLVYPAMAFLFAKSFEDLSAPTEGNDDYMKNVRNMVFQFLYLGAFGFFTLVGQATCLEIAASLSTTDFKTQWFEALLRQDMAYFDIKDVSAQATFVSVNSKKYHKGTGRKLGEGIQFSTTVVGGIAYAFWASWEVSLLVLAAVPIMAISAIFVMKVTTKQTEMKNKNYAETGGIVYGTISSIRTIFALNASNNMIQRFQKSTEKAYKKSTSVLVWVGLGNGSMMASFLISYIAVTLYGAFLMYSELRDTGCDPSSAVPGAESCSVIGTEVFGALMGISFGAMGLAQISAAAEAFIGARSATYPALLAINRKVGNDDVVTDLESNAAAAATEKKKDEETEKDKEIPLPKYVIDSTSPDGLKPSSVAGEVMFNNVSFTYPTRPDALVFDGLNLKVDAGKTVALVGPSGGGKSTTVSLLERFYDPTAGSITLDGHDIRNLNVQWLREQIGLVAQEPTLFARSIKENISYGCPGATDEDIMTVAKSANAHSFIMKFPDGYETMVGDKGAQLSGGQKQRIAIARVLLKNPKILLLDEATSALDSESEHVVQEALDGLVGSGGRTTIVIAHRLSTIRNADMIAVIKAGRVVETGTHDELVSRFDSEYAKLVHAQSGPTDDASVISETTTMVKSLAGSVMSGFGTSVAVNKANEVEVSNVPSQLTLRNVHFSYPTRPGIEIFKGLNLSIRQGETLAIVGPSGGGKSTVIQLIERFYDPISGNVELDGVDLTKLNLKWLRDQLGLVSQEPTLFNTTIGENIKYGYPGATQKEIEEAAKKANAHDFITSFPAGYDTKVGENATQVSGGQKQRIAIARALIKNPKILLLDEATSALDSGSEQVVQEAINELMESKSQTVVVIAHRLSTIKNADRIAVIADGMVKELGSHNDLMSVPDGRYKRLVEFQSMESNTKKPNKSKEEEEDEDDDDVSVSTAASKDEETQKNEDKKYAAQARSLSRPDLGLFFIGSIGSILAGVVFPGWGFIFAYMIELLYRPILPCDPDSPVSIDAINSSEFLALDKAYDSCEDYWDSEADGLRLLSIDVTYGWLGLIGATMVGNALLFYGFGTATERMNKRVRDSVFSALMRQDLAYYDKHPVGNLSSQIEDDAAMIHSFSGEPIRSFMMSLSSVVVGLVVAFVYMWPFALMVLVILPFMSFGAYIEMKMYMGEDEGADQPKEGEDRSGSIVVETLLSIRTVASLAIEKMRSAEYSAALEREDPAAVKTNLLKGSATGIGFLIQLWGMGFMFWWGAWLLDRYPSVYDARSYYISMFSLLFSLSGLSVAMMGLTDQTKAKKAAKRIFRLIDSSSAINALSESGMKGKEV